MALINPGVGLIHSVGRDGIGIEILPSTNGAAAHPFLVRLFKEGSTWKFKVVPGTVNSKVPTINDVKIDTPAPLTPAGTISASGYVYIECTYEEGSGFPITAKIEYATTVPADTDTKSHVNLASVELASGKAKKLAQFVSTSLWGERLKCGSSTAEYYYSRA
jgi:hypothetical protein